MEMRNTLKRNEKLIGAANDHKTAIPVCLEVSNLKLILVMFLLYFVLCYSFAVVFGSS
jgi:hypothetical protein